MSEEDFKAIVAKYQQKSFELFNSNIVLEVQMETLKKTIESLTIELEKLKKTSKRTGKVEDDF